MFKKWWVILIQGILMFILGIFIFNNPAEVLAGVSLWFGILILLTGVTGLIGWIFAGKDNRETGTLIWSIISALIGMIVLMNLLAAMKVITVVFGFWVLMTGFSLFNSGWSIKKESVIGWILLIIGLLSILAGLSMIFNIGSGATGVAVILGIQVILAGLSLILLSFVKKAVAGKIRDSINSLKQ